MISEVVQHTSMEEVKIKIPKLGLLYFVRLQLISRLESLIIRATAFVKSGFIEKLGHIF